MPVSKKQLRANRRNAQKSTGPKSVEGKQMASRNGVKYGLYSQDLIITSTNLKENKEEYDRLLDSLLGELQPQTGMQLYLVHKIANCLWRSRRAIRAETAIVTRQLDHIDRDLELRNRFLGVARQVDDDDDGEYEMTPEEEEHFRTVEMGRQSIPNEKFAVNILRYEMRLDRQLTRAYKLLTQLQDRQNRNQAETDGREEIFVPVFKCPAEHGMECPRDPQSVEGGLEHRERQERVPDAAERDDIESRPRGAGHPGSQSPDRMPYPSYGPVTTAEEGFERPTVDMRTHGADEDPPQADRPQDQTNGWPGRSSGSQGRSRRPVPTPQKHLSPRPPLPQGEGLGVRQIDP